MASLDLATTRFARSFEMIATAEAALESQQHSSALLLYVTALEMIGWEINAQLGLTATFGKQFRRSMHKLRHFVAVSAFVADLLLVFAPNVLSEIDFAKLRFKRIARQGKSKEADWRPQAATGIMHEIGSMVSPTYVIQDIPEGTPPYVAVMNLRLAMNFLGSAALGFLDNHRLALIHDDNAFNFETYHGDGTTSSNQKLDPVTTSNNYAYLLPAIVSCLKKPAVLDFLHLNLRAMIGAFEGPLLEGSYVS